MGEPRTPALQPFRRRMQAAAIDERAIQAFERMLESYLGGETGKVPWAEVEPMHPEDLVPFAALDHADLHEEGLRQLGRLVVIRVNGGLGTTMKLERAKSLIRVRGEQSFLDLTVEQVLWLRQRHQVQVPWLAMNSFRTREDTLAALAGRKVAIGELPIDFVQNRVPRIDRSTRLPLEASQGGGDEEACWAPPGHGDIYLSLWISGLLEQLIAAGYRWAFVANVDNLGATFHPGILGYLERERLEFASEVTDKSLADVKGGTIIRRRGRLTLLEGAQVEPEHSRDFEDSRVFGTFNTNNLWFRLEAVLEKMRRAELELPLIVNPKKVLGREVVQLEAAMGAAVGCFERTRALHVPRSRFAPVKATCDLLAVRSDAYLLDETFAIRPSPARDPAQGPPVIRLDDPCYKGIDDFEARFPHPLSLLRCRSLTVRGDLRFGRDVCVEGEVVLQNRSGAPRAVPDGARFADGTFDV
jgi:UTP--glucose-1-phosphate uridylyltransferase